ncbi:MAG: hypothetical protein J7L83_04315 [Thaumarchaeota archaeon]|nr:hypothetical protein [Nitrososphaerota archaeon]
MSDEKLARKALEIGNGILRLAPTWVPRPPSRGDPGKRLKLAPQDLYILGMKRGAICERWIASTTRADNPGAPEDEGLSYVFFEESGEIKRILLKTAIEILGDEYLGKSVMRKYGGLKAYTKFFDYAGPLPFHIHQKDEQLKELGKEGKPEAYYFPPQLNSYEGRFPYTFFGLDPSTTRQDIIECLKRWDQGDNGILDLSRAYRIRPGTSWIVQAGILHAPGSLLTYEPQKSSDVFAMFQSVVEGREIPWDLVVKDVPDRHKNDLDYLVDLIDWEVNIDPDFKKHHFLKHVPVKDPEEMKKEGYFEKWIVYGTDDFSAKELIVYPGKTAVIKDELAYGMILVQGRGEVGTYEAETPTMIRYGELTRDEFFVTIEAAKEGVKITNTGNENLVILKNFGPGNPEAPKLTAT